MPVLFVVEVTM